MVRAAYLVGVRAGGLLLALVAWVPLTTSRNGDGAGSFTMSASDGKESGASCTVTREGLFEVRQWGVRRLWDEIAAAHQWWLRAGLPGMDRLGLTVQPEAQTLWLDAPGPPDLHAPPR